MKVLLPNMINSWNNDAQISGWMLRVTNFPETPWLPDGDTLTGASFTSFLRILLFLADLCLQLKVRKIVLNCSVNLAYDFNTLLLTKPG